MAELNVMTARYANPNIAGSGLVAVGITRYPPRFPLPYELLLRGLLSPLLALGGYLSQAPVENPMCAPAPGANRAEER